MGLLRSTATVGGYTLLSRILGFARDMVFAYVFGAGKVTDAFFVAFKIPNFLRRLFAEGAFSQAFVPVLTEYKNRHPEDVGPLVGYVTGTLGAILILLSIVAALASPLLVSVFAPGFHDPERFALTTQMLRITFPYLLFISLTALAGGILNTFGRFAVPAFTPVLLNVCLIGAALWAAPHFAEPVLALAWGVFVAGLAQLLFQFPFLARLGLLRRPRLGRHAGVQRIMRLMLPALFGSSVAQVNLLFDTIIASFLAAGSVSWLYYSDRLVEFPLGVFGIALATVILPSLSEKHARAAPEEFRRTLDWALRWALLIGTPASLGLIMLAGPVIATLFQHGAFVAADVRMAALSLMAYAAGLMGFILVKVLAPGYYARQDTRSPVRIGVIAMFTNIVLNVGFAVPMTLLGVPGAHAGLALATSLAAFVNAGLLLRGLRRAGVYRPLSGWRRVVGQALAANAAMGAALWWASPPLQGWLALSALQRGVLLAAVIGFGAVVYAAVLWAGGVRLGQLRAPLTSSS